MATTPGLCPGPCGHARIVPSRGRVRRRAPPPPAIASASRTLQTGSGRHGEEKNRETRRSHRSMRAPRRPRRHAVGARARVLAAAAAHPAHAGASVVDGAARFQVITPTLIRMEYAADGRFEDRPTFNALARGVTPPPYSVRKERTALEIRTARLVLRYTSDSS